MFTFIDPAITFLRSSHKEIIRNEDKDLCEETI